MSDILTFGLDSLVTIKLGQLEALIKDKRRVDYIEQNFHVLGFTLGDNWMPVSIADKRRFPDMRSALDAIQKMREAAKCVS